MFIPLVCLFSLAVAEPPVSDGYSTARSHNHNHHSDFQRTPSEDYGPLTLTRNSLITEYGAPNLDRNSFSAPGSHKTSPRKITPPAARTTFSQTFGSRSQKNGYEGRSGLSEELDVPNTRNVPSQEYGVPSAGIGLSQGYDERNARNGLSQEYGVPNARSGLSQEYGLPNAKSGLSQEYVVPNSGRGLSQEYGVPNARNGLSQEYGVPNDRNGLSQEYGLPNARNGLSQEYGVPNARNGLSQEYGVSNARNGLSQEYGVPNTRNGLSQEYGIPNARNGLSQEYGVPNVRSGLSDEYNTRGLSSRSLSTEYGIPDARSTPSEEYGAPAVARSGIKGSISSKTLSSARSVFKPSSYSLKDFNARNLSPASRNVFSSARSYTSTRDSDTYSQEYTAPSKTYGVPNTKIPSEEYGVPSSRAQLKTNAVASSYPSSRSSPSLHPPSARSKPSEEYGVPAQYSALSDQGYHYARGSLDENQEPANYDFAYKVSDSESGSDFGHSESRQEDHAEGTYFVVLPDGTKQTVEYEADERGFKPKISVEPAYSRGGYDENAANLPSSGPY